MEEQTVNEAAVLVLQEKEKLPVRSRKEKQANDKPVLGHTLIDLLYDTATHFSNPRMFNHKRGGSWVPVSLDEFRVRVELLAASFGELGLEQGDRVALYMDSDTYFCIADMACLLAGLIDVPIYLKQSPGIFKNQMAECPGQSSESQLRPKRSWSHAKPHSRPLYRE